MKSITAILCVLAFSSMATAQNPDPSKWMCRNLADSGNFAYQGETIFGTQACRLRRDKTLQAQSQFRDQRRSRIRRPLRLMWYP
jgi:hypothetical protein